MRKKFVLTKTQKKELTDIEKQVENKKLVRKLQCINMKDKGLTHKVVWEILWVTPKTISGWIKIYREWWVLALLERNYEWKVSLLTHKQLEEIRKYNKENPFDTAKEAKHYIEQNFKIKYHLHWVQKMLKKNFFCHTKNKSNCPENCQV